MSQGDDGHITNSPMNLFKFNKFQTGLLFEKYLVQFKAHTFAQFRSVLPHTILSLSFSYATSANLDFTKIYFPRAPCHQVQRIRIEILFGSAQKTLGFFY